MKLNDFDTLFDAAQPLPAYSPRRSWRAAVGVLMVRLEQAWVGLYALPPRRLGPMI
jgi:hypothetical protein